MFINVTRITITAFVMKVKFYILSEELAQNQTSYVDFELTLIWQWPYSNIQRLVHFNMAVTLQ